MLDIQRCVLGIRLCVLVVGQGVRKILGGLGLVKNGCGAELVGLERTSEEKDTRIDVRCE